MSLLSPQFVFDGFIGSNKTNVIAIDDFKISMKNVGLENLHAAWSQYQLLKNTSNGAFQTYNNEEDDEDRQSPEELIRRLEDIVWGDNYKGAKKHGDMYSNSMIWAGNGGRIWFKMIVQSILFIRGFWPFYSIVSIPIM